MTENDTLFNLLIKEKERLVSELVEYNKRLDRTVSLYLAGAYAAIGVVASGTFRETSVLGAEARVWLVFLFLLVNCCVLVQATSFNCWTISLAKFIHMKLDPKLLELAGATIKPDRCKETSLSDVDTLGWDDWREEIKGLGLLARGTKDTLWVVLVVATSVLSLWLVDIPAFLKHNYFVGCGIIAFLIVAYIFAFCQMIAGMFYIKRFHYPIVKVKWPNLFPRQRLKDRRV